MKKKHQKLPSNWDEREALRHKGQFWTPTWVAEPMVEYVAGRGNLIFDPASGEGAFLDALIKLYGTSYNFYGTDVDANVLECPIYNAQNCTVEVRDFLKEAPRGLYSAIVANPPYIRHHRIDAKTKEFLKTLCQRITGFVVDGRAGYHIYFLLQALSLLEDNGKLAFIMPADTCEGKFSGQLWQWITSNYCLDCVISFTDEATPFPNVDTNALVFLITKRQQTANFIWVKSNQPYTEDLLTFVRSGFEERELPSLSVQVRETTEGLETGLSRPMQANVNHEFRLSDFASVMRGIATGANEFFFLTRAQAEEIGLPNNLLKVAVGRTKDVPGNTLTDADIENLNNNGKPTLILSINGERELPESVLNYLKKGEELGLNARSLIQTRKPWYKMEQRVVPALWFAYLGRRNSRFIKNDANALPLTGFLCVYPKSNHEQFINNLWIVLNHPDTLENLHLVGKSYGSNAIKVEPRNLDKLPIPSHLVREYNLTRWVRQSEPELTTA